MAEIENKFHKSVIYKIVSNDKNDTNMYVGSTTLYEHRQGQHKTDCHNVNGEGNKYKV